MEFVTKMEKAFDYIESHLLEDIDYQELSLVSECSPHNFQRIFTYITDKTLVEYIRQRRLSKASLELQSTEIKIIDLAIKYGYESASSFTRAFQQLQGVSPSIARKNKCILKEYPRLTFKLSVSGLEPLNYRVEIKPAFKMMGIKQGMSIKGEQNLICIPKMWKDLSQEKYKQIESCSIENTPYVYGVSANFNNEGFDYYIVSISDKDTPDDMVDIYVPETKWIIFSCVGSIPIAFQKMMKRIYTEWLPFNDYEITEEPQLEWYSQGNTLSEEYQSEIWLPIRKRKE